MTISVMGKKWVGLGLAMCFLVSSFHEISCQVEGIGAKFGTSQNQEIESNFRSLSQQESSSASMSVETASEAVSGQSSSSSEQVRRLMEGFGEQAGSAGGHGESMESSGNAEMQKQLEEMQQKFQDRKSAEAEETKYEDVMINEPKIITGTTGSSTIESQSQKIDSTHISSRSVVGSLGIGQSGAWRCVNPDRSGGKEDDSMVIPMYELEDIIKQESTEGKTTKTSSLITSLTEIVEKHKKGLWSTDVKIGTVTSTETTQKIEKLKVTLKNYRGMHVRELVSRSDYEEIISMAARYEQLTGASVMYISKLSTYGTVIKEGFKASQRVQTVHQRVKLHENMAMEKQKRVDAEFEAVKAVAKKGDSLYVKIFAMKRLVLKYEAEKKEADLEFQRSVASLSRVLEEASQTYEKYHVVQREWKEVQASVEYSRETIERAEVVWVQFLNTL